MEEDEDEEESEDTNSGEIKKVSSFKESRDRRKRFALDKKR